MAYSKESVGKIVLMFFARRGMLPVGTTAANWRDIKMKEFQFDDPPISTDAHFVKRKIAQEMMTLFADIGLQIASPLATLKGATNTMRDLVDFVFSNKQEVKAL